MAEQAHKNTINANTIPSFKIKKKITSFTLGVITGIRQNELGQFFIIFNPHPLGKCEQLFHFNCMKQIGICAVLGHRVYFSFIFNYKVTSHCFRNYCPRAHH